MRNALTTGYRREGLRETPRFLRCPSQEGHRRSQHALEGKTMNQDQAYLLSQPYCFQMGFQDFRGGEQFDSRRNAEWQRGWRWANAKSVSRSK
ncbi:hypothetical protein [Pseudomonas aeruginosa]|nr:hypothetical protein [Pseudomonas aeruginosa]